MTFDRKLDEYVKLTAVLCVRNEAAFLLDWLAWHRSMGVTDFVVISNECDDGTDAMLDRLAELGWLTHLRNAPPYGKSGIQFSGLKLAQKTQAVRDADWLLVLDIDEFVNVHVGDRTLPALVNALPEATAITLTWRVFGNAGIVDYDDTPVPVQFTKAAPNQLPWPWRAAMFKTLYRNDKTYRNLGIHRPRNPVETRIADAHWFDGSGRALSEAWSTKRLFSDYSLDTRKLAQLNHYPLGAMHSYVLKSDRGRAVHNRDSLGLDYWVERNLNVEDDMSALPLWDRAAPILTTLSSDNILADLHAKAVLWRNSRFEQLLLQDQYRDLFGRLLMSAPSQPISQRHAQTLAKKAIKSQQNKAKPEAETP